MHQVAHDVWHWLIRELEIRHHSIQFEKCDILDQTCWTVDLDYLIIAYYRLAPSIKKHDSSWDWTFAVARCGFSDCVLQRFVPCGLGTKMTSELGKRPWRESSPEFAYCILLWNALNTLNTFLSDLSVLIIVSWFGGSRCLNWHVRLYDAPLASFHSELLPG